MALRMGAASDRKFSKEVETYVVLLLKLSDYRASSRTLPDGFELTGVERRREFRHQEKKLLEDKFEDWGIPFCGKLRGWRADSPIYVVRGEKLIGGAYLCDKNEFDDDVARGQLHYMFVQSDSSGQGLYSVIFREAVRRAKSWGLEEILINTDRHLLPEVHIRWGATPWKEIKKESRLLHNALGRILRQTRRQFRRVSQIGSKPCE